MLDWPLLQEHVRDRRRRKRRLAAVVIALLAVVGYVGARIAPRFEGPRPRVEAQGPELPPVDTGSEVLRRVSWPKPSRAGDGYEQWVGPYRIRYTLEPELQEEALAVFRRYKVPYGAFVAVEPSTGRILAMAEYSRADPALRDFCRRATYPAASLVKVVTAAAALEAGVVTPDTRIRFEGSPYRLYPRKISPKNRRREHNVHTVAQALGSSNNVVFGKIGAQLLGAERLREALAAFGFNQPLRFDFRLQVSRASVPAEPYPLARTAAGFGDVYLSPIHAALIAAAVGNRGVMMRPYIVDTIEDAAGDAVYRAAPAPLGRCTTEAVAAQVARMMERTVTQGTSAKVFYRYARRLRRKVGVAGKTGSLTGDDPPGKYEWFIGFAPVDGPRIAVASLVVNRGDLWHIKGSYTAQAVMREFYGM